MINNFKLQSASIRTVSQYVTVVRCINIVTLGKPYRTNYSRQVNVREYQKVIVIIYDL